MKTLTPADTQNLSINDITKITNALEEYRNSPWFTEDHDFSFDGLLISANKDGVDKVLNSIRRADIRAFHAEEAACGNI